MPASFNSRLVRFSTTVTWNWRGSMMMAKADSAISSSHRLSGVSYDSAVMTASFSVAFCHRSVGPSNRKNTT